MHLRLQDLIFCDRFETAEVGDVIIAVAVFDSRVLVQYPAVVRDMRKHRDETYYLVDRLVKWDWRWPGWALGDNFVRVAKNFSRIWKRSQAARKIQRCWRRHLFWRPGGPGYHRAAEHWADTC